MIGTVHSNSETLLKREDADFIRRKKSFATIAELSTVRQYFLTLTVTLSVLTFLLGCGGGGGGGTAVSGVPQVSSGNTVVRPPGTPPTTPNPTAPIARTSVLFQFARAQSVLEVPSTTSRLRFLFLSGPGGEGSLLLERVVDFAAAVRIEGVPVSARSVRVSALDANGNPILWSFTNLNLVESQETEVTWTFHQPVLAEELIIPQTLTLVRGTEQSVPVTLRLSDQSVVQVAEATWSVSNGNAVVNKNGLVSALTVGTSVLTVRVGDLEAQMELEITPVPVVSPSLQGISADPDILQLKADSTTQILVLGEFSNGQVRELDPVIDGVSFLSTNPAIASVEANGTLTAVSEGTATVDVSVGDFTDAVTVVVEPSETSGNRPPGLLFDNQVGYFDSRQTIGTPFSPTNVQVTDDQIDFENGELKLSFRQPFPSGMVLSNTITVPNLPVIGSVVGNGTDEINVSLTSDATPATVQAFLEGVQIEYQGSQALISLRADLEDGRGGTTRAFNTFSMRGEAVQLTVNRNLPLSATNFHSVHEAVLEAEKIAGPGSTVTVAAGDYQAGPNTNPEVINFNFIELGGVEFLGAHAGVPAGVNAGVRATPSLLPPTNLRNFGAVTFDGLDFRKGAAGRGTGIDGALFFIDSAGATLKNCSFQATNQDVAGVEIITREPVEIIDCRFQRGYGGINSSIFVEELLVQGCRFLDAPVGIFFGDNLAQQFTLEESVFEASCSVAMDIRGLTDPTILTAINNSFLSPVGVRLDQFTVGSFDFNNNWWGQSSGPRSDQIQSDSSFGRVLTNPFLTSDPNP